MASDVTGKARENPRFSKLRFFRFPEFSNRDLGTFPSRPPDKPPKKEHTNNEQVPKEIHDLSLLSEDDELELPQVAQLVEVQELQLELEDEELLER